MSENLLKKPTEKEIYSQLCEREKSIPLFSRPWWLDESVGSENWDVISVMRGDEVVASMPYVKKRRLLFTEITMPKLTPKLGPWIKPIEAKLTTQLDREKEYLSELLEGLPRFTYFVQAWDMKYKYWFPFYWAGFEQTTRYTYVLDDLTDMDALWGGLRENIRRECRKAEKRFQIVVKDDLGISEFLKLNALTYQRQGRLPPDSSEFLERMDKVCSENKCRKIFIALDPDGKMHAGVYLVWDENSAYYLMGGGDPELRNSGATSLCMWQAINFASTVTQKFDFEGSMIQQVEKFFRGFGAKPAEYYLITKSNSVLYSLLVTFRPLLKKYYLAGQNFLIRLIKVK